MPRACFVHTDATWSAQNGARACHDTASVERGAQNGARRTERAERDRMRQPVRIPREASVPR